jgi:hypothetical protein
MIVLMAALLIAAIIQFSVMGSTPADTAPSTPGGTIAVTTTVGGAVNSANPTP